MNPYPKGLGSQVYAQSAPTSAGKVATHFNSPYMRAISQNLMTAIYGSPQDELTRQRIEQSKLAMEQTKAQMAATEDQNTARASLGALLGDPSSYDENGNLTQQARAAGVQLNLASGGSIDDLLVDTGAYQRNRGMEAFRHGNNVEIEGVRHGHNVELANVGYGHKRGLAEQAFGFDVDLEGVRHNNTLEQENLRHSNLLARDNNQNAWQAGQNEIERDLEAAQALVDSVHDLDYQSPDQVISIANVLGVPLSMSESEGMTGIEPHRTGYGYGYGYGRGGSGMLDLKRADDYLFTAYGLDKDKAAHLAQFAQISQRLAQLSATTDLPFNQLVAQVQREFSWDPDKEEFTSSVGNDGVWGIKKVN